MTTLESKVSHAIAQGRFAEAVEAYDRAFDQGLNVDRLRLHRIIALLALGRWDGVVSSCDSAIAIKKLEAEARLIRGKIHLMLGDFPRGWIDNEWRVRTYPFQPPMAAAGELLGRDLAGMTVLVRHEWGMGDALQFCRYIPLIARLGAKVILQAPRPLAPLFERMEGAAQIVVLDDKLPQFNYQYFMMSLPLAFGTTLSTIPAEIPYLHADPRKIAAWRARLGPRRCPRIGVVWSGSGCNENPGLQSGELVQAVARNVRLADLLEFLPRGFEYFRLQKDVIEEDRATLAVNPRIIDFGDDLGDFDTTGALMECMDLIVTTDTGLAHLAGGLGKPTWIMLPRRPCWRWLLDRTDSPWYPSVRLYRDCGDQSRMLANVREDLLRGFRAMPAEALPAVMTRHYLRV